jgi:hypothetical protein
MVLRWHGHRREHGRRRRRAVGSAGGTRVVLTATPRQPNPRVANGVALHLVDRHLGRMPLNKLHKTTALSGRNLDVSDFSEALEERTKFIFSDVSRESSDEDSGVVWVGKLVHGLGSSIVTHRGGTHGVHASHGASGARHGGRRTGPALRSGGRDAHGAVATVDALHLRQGAVLILLIRESNKSVTTRHATDRIGHNLGRLARREPRLEKRDENVFVDLGAKITDEDGVLRAAIVATEKSIVYPK